MMRRGRGPSASTALPLAVMADIDSFTALGPVQGTPTVAGNEVAFEEARCPWTPNGQATTRKKKKKRKPALIGPTHGTT